MDSNKYIITKAKCWPVFNKTYLQYCLALMILAALFVKAMRLHYTSLPDSPEDDSLTHH